MPLVDVHAHYKVVQPAVEAAAVRVLASGRSVADLDVSEFEQSFAAYCNVRHAIAVNSGSSALHLSLLGANIGPDDEVIVSPLASVTTLNAICATGARPVFVDIEPRTYNIDPAGIADAITPRTKAIMSVHLYGLMADMDRLLAIGRDANIVVLEDACQAHGALYQGSRAGSMGLSGSFSFGPGKNLGATSGGGMVVTDDDEQAQYLRCIRNWAQEGRYSEVRRGSDYRMTTLQAAILGVKLQHLEQWTEMRRAHARRLTCQLRHSAVMPPSEPEGYRHVYNAYVIRSPSRDLLRAAIATRGVEAGSHYPRAIHLQRAYAHLGYREGDFPQAEQAAGEILSLPIYPELTDSQVDHIALAVRSDAMPQGVSSPRRIVRSSDQVEHTMSPAQSEEAA